MIRLVFLAFILIGTSACASGAPKDDEEAEPTRRRSFLTSALLYLPNRLVDVFDLARFGVNVGPGLGIHATATEVLQVAAMSRFSVGLGYQTLRHSPIHAGVDTALAVGPIAGTPSAGLSWYRSPTDLRLELHLLLAGGHVAVDPVEILDLVVGFIGLDPKKDDF